MFHDRIDAGRQLARHLRYLQGTKPLVLGIIRGGVPLAFEVARNLEGTFGIIWVKKIGSPDNPEYAWGAMTDHNEIVLSNLMPIDEEYIREVVKRRESEWQVWRRRFGAATSLDTCLGRVVVIVDDGIATGSTMIAALRRVRSFQPSRLIAAVPVAPIETVESIKAEADDWIAIATPSHFHSVSSYYDDFRPVSDEDVAAYLDQSLRQP